MRRGASLLELLVALLLLELVGLGALSAALTADRIGRRLGLASQTDAERWSRLRASAVDPGCDDSLPPRLGSVDWPAATDRPAATVLVRCGQ
ncbi:MAG: hypothetical protein IPO52_03230 [Gemmatimonadetes bacterium]|jgi:hypothetical protein|nr:hypothetical protein [Gemmatimonadota bacterium]MBP6442407.1 hypothetical protein [Gemmatimonadales bacterium]MBK9548132.1 hypothetical protein [Gemmatimonadota bacterium]MBP6569918.1 hypothetical protein [Gemmatimonadales bacterium]MBP7620367.1 hypothetical protein [Gemmatimonadales bacterium]